MYIRRKVFSSYLDESGEERLYSTYSPKVKAANFVHGGVTNQTFKPNNTSFIGKMGKFIGNHKVGTAVAGTALATGAGLLAYSHYKNNNNNNNNNNQQ
jgi:uncharacterized membrane protein YebE (DUF533 family)